MSGRQRNESRLEMKARLEAEKSLPKPYVPLGRPVGSKNWSEKKKIQVVTTYLALGNAPLTEGVTGVPRQTIRMWKMQPWWKEIESDIRNEENLGLDIKLSKIVDKALDVVVDRLENGDFQLDSKSGKVSRVPVKMRDATSATNTLLDKRALLRNQPTKIVAQQAFDDRLLKLAEQFATFALGKKEPKVITGEVIEDAIYVGGEEGLQEGVELGAQEETYEGEGQGSTEQSEEYDGEEGLSDEGGWQGRGPQEGNIEGWYDDSDEPEGSNGLGKPQL